MSSAALDRLLAVLIIVELVTGLFTLRAGIPATAPLFWVHGIMAGSLLLASFEKLRRSLRAAIDRRRWPAWGSLVPSRCSPPALWPAGSHG